MNTRQHTGFAHGLAPGTAQDMNCLSCRAEAACTGRGPGYITFGHGPLRTSFEPQLAQTAPGQWSLTVTITRAGTTDSWTAGPATIGAPDYPAAARKAGGQLLALATGMGVLQ